MKNINIQDALEILLEFSSSFLWLSWEHSSGFPRKPTPELEQYLSTEVSSVQLILLIITFGGERHTGCNENK